MSKKKKIIIISIAAFVLIAGSVTATLLILRHNTTLYNDTVNTSMLNISDWSSQFDRATNHERRVALYHGLRSSHTEYISMESSSNNEIVNLFETTLSTMETRFFDYYNTTITEVEGVIVPELLTEIISVFDNNISRLSTIKTGISDDAVFSNDITRLNQLNNKAENLLGYFRDANVWLSGIVEYNDKFSAASRDEKFTVFKEILSFQEDFKNSASTNELVESELNAAVEEKRMWFADWYTDNITWLHLSTTNDHGIEETINALKQLTDLAQLLASEGEVLFASVGINLLNSSIDDAVSNNLTVLRNTGISAINDKGFHEGAAEKAIEHFNEAFAEWKENFSDSQSPLKFEELLQEAVEIGEAENITFLRAEAARRTRVGST